MNISPWTILGWGLLLLICIPIAIRIMAMGVLLVITMFFWLRLGVLYCVNRSRYHSELESYKEHKAKLELAKAFEDLARSIK